MEAPTDTSLQQKNFEQLADAKRYYRWMTDTFAPWIGKRILEVGCGQGNITVNLLDKEFVLGIDFHEEYLQNIRQRFSKYPNFKAENKDITKDTAELQAHAFDTIVCVNVLEHIEDDVEGAQQMYDILEPGGHAIILVPAFNYLFSPFDTLVGHYRRYTKKTLRKSLESAHFKVKKVYYFNILGAIGWFIVFKLLKHNAAGSGNVALLEKLVPLLSKIEKLPMPFGLSVIAIGEKPRHTNKHN